MYDKMPFIYLNSCYKVLHQIKVYVFLKPESGIVLLWKHSETFNYLLTGFRAVVLNYKVHLFKCMFTVCIMTIIIQLKCWQFYSKVNRQDGTTVVSMENNI